MLGSSKNDNYKSIQIFISANIQTLDFEILEFILTVLIKIKCFQDMLNNVEEFEVFTD